jgi:cytochrome c peroxidase
MRYAALNQGMDMLTSYNNFIPMGINSYSELPGNDEWDHPFGYDPYRYTDAQLYALAQYIYSLKPPENPNKYSEKMLSDGELIFTEQGCITCHTPPLYTNNMLTPADGFDPPKNHFELYDIFNVSVETDPNTTLKSRRGTGYYKIPSLLGVWYRGPFFHNGELATLEDVLDSKRLSDDYVPTGYKPPHVKTKAVKGHDFGLELSGEENEALIAFLKSLSDD